MEGPCCLTEEQSDSMGVCANEAWPSWCVFKPAKNLVFFFLYSCMHWSLNLQRATHYHCLGSPCVTHSWVTNPLFITHWVTPPLLNEQHHGVFCFSSTFSKDFAPHSSKKKSRKKRLKNKMSTRVLPKLLWNRKELGMTRWYSSPAGWRLGLLCCRCGLDFPAEQEIFLP